MLGDYIAKQKYVHLYIRTYLFIHSCDLSSLEFDYIPSPSPN